MQPLLADMLGILPRDGAGISIVTAIEISIVAAVVLAILFHRFKQPALLAYIVAGLVLSLVAKPMLGPSVERMQQISHLGLVFLLFIIGIEMDLKGILRLGKRAAAAILLQGPLAIAVVWGAQWALDAAGITVPGLGSSPRAWFFFSVAIALSSTAVVVKLLADKFDLTSQAGTVTVLTLIAQDIWAVLALSYVATQGKQTSGGGTVAIMLIGALLAAVVLWLVARYALTWIMKRLSQSPDLLALTALGWCFIGTAALSSVGLSAEMGALIAGLTLGSLPMAAEILTKVSNLRDFFMALFFVALGMTLPPPTLAVMGSALALVAIVIVTRLVLFTPTLLHARLGPLVSVTASINLAQISEFSLLLVPVGVAAGALTVDESSIISYAMMLSVVAATYGIKYNYQIAQLLVRFLPAARVSDTVCAELSDEHPQGAPVVMLGFHTNAEALVRRLRHERPTLLDKLLVIDYNYKNHAKIRSYGVQVAYGDISNPESLRHHGVDKAMVVVSTIGNTFLRGTSNLQLLQQIKTLNPAVRFIGTASTSEDAEELVRKGAFGCVCPPDDAAPRYVDFLKRSLDVECAPP